MKKLSYWEADLFEKDLDLLIVGGGLTGLFSALEYRRLYPEARICILDAQGISRSASTRNAGFLCFGGPSEIIEDAESMGWENAINLCLRRYRGLKALLASVDQRAIEYGADGGYEIFMGAAPDDAVIDRMNHGLREIGSPVFKYYTPIEDWGFNGVQSIVYNAYEGSIHPAKLVFELKRLCAQNRIHLAEGIKAEKVSHGLVHTRGFDKPFAAKKVLLATNGLTTELLDEVDIRPARNMVMVVKPAKKIKWSGTFHMDRGYVYFRNVHGHLLIGGGRNIDCENEYTTAYGVNDTIRDYLTGLIEQVILPGQSYEVISEWSGILAFSGSGDTKAPIVKQVDDCTYVAARLSGMGVALSKFVADEVVRLMHVD